MSSRTGVATFPATFPERGRSGGGKGRADHGVRPRSAGEQACGACVASARTGASPRALRSDGGTIRGDGSSVFTGVSADPRGGSTARWHSRCPAGYILAAAVCKRPDNH